MTDMMKPPGRELAPRPGYEVGYARPPRDTRFKPGQSGNPRGRPKGARNKRPGLHEERLKDIILDEAYRGVTVRDGDRTVRISVAQAIVRAMAVKAAKGEHRAQRLFAQLLASVESSRKMLYDEYFDKALTYKLAWEEELDRRRRMGVKHLPDPLPHPDQIRIDMREGTVRMVGPMTREEKAEVDHWREKLPLIAEAVADLREQLPYETDPEERASIEEHIRIGEEMTEKISKALEGL